MSQTAATDGDGRYHIPYVPAGKINVWHKLAAEGHEDAGIMTVVPRFDNLSLLPAQSLTVHFGGPGKTVIGRLSGSETYGKVRISMNMQQQRPMRVIF